MGFLYLFVCLFCFVFNSGDVPLVEFMYLVSARIPGESYRRRLRSLAFVLVLRISSANYLPCALILSERKQRKSGHDDNTAFQGAVYPS